MTDNTIHFLFGIVSLFLGFFMLTPIFNVTKKNKYDNSKNKQIKFSLSLILLIIGLYTTVNYRYEIKPKPIFNKEWSIEDRNYLIHKCKKDAMQTYIDYPEYTEAYCKCSMENITRTLNKDDYEKSLTKSQEDQMKQIFPLFEECFKKLKKSIDSIKSIQN